MTAIQPCISSQVASIGEALDILSQQFGSSRFANAGNTQQQIPLLFETWMATNMLFNACLHIADLLIQKLEVFLQHGLDPGRWIGRLQAIILLGAPVRCDVFVGDEIKSLLPRPSFFPTIGLIPLE